MSHITISPKHGVNPSLLICPICGEPSGVALVGRLPNDAEAHRQMLDQEPCASCKEHMLNGIFIIEINEELTKDITNPHRTGRLACITNQAFDRLLPEGELKEDIKKKRICFMPISAFEAIGLAGIVEDQAKS